MTKANLLTSYCITVLTAKGFYVWRQNSIPVYDAKIGKYRANNVHKGVPDILGFNKLTGKFICVEIKIGKDKLSIYQTEFLNAATKATAYVFVVKTSNDVEDMAKNI